MKITNTTVATVKPPQTFTIEVDERELEYLTKVPGKADDDWKDSTGEDVRDLGYAVYSALVVAN